MAGASRLANEAGVGTKHKVSLSGAIHQPLGGKKFESLNITTGITIPSLEPRPSSALPAPAFLYSARHVPHAAATDASAGIGPEPARIRQWQLQKLQQLQQRHQRQKESALGADAASRLLRGRAQPDEPRRIRPCLDRLHDRHGGQAERHDCR